MTSTPELRGKCMRNMAANYRMFQQADRDLAAYRQSIDQAA